MSDALYLETKADVDEAFEELGFSAVLKVTDSLGNVNDHDVVLVRAGEPERKNDMGVPVGDVEYVMQDGSVNPKETDIIQFSDGEKEVIMRSEAIKPGNIVIAWSLITSFT